MDIKKEREAFVENYRKVYKVDKSLFVNDSGEFTDLFCQDAWVMWQATKAQAVPEGFVLVSQKDLLELTIAINAVDLATHTESKTNEVREMWQQVALKLMALGISQEQAND